MLLLKLIANQSILEVCQALRMESIPDEAIYEALLTLAIQHVAFMEDLNKELDNGKAFTQEEYDKFQDLAKSIKTQLVTHLEDHIKCGQPKS